MFQLIVLEELLHLAIFKRVDTCSVITERMKRWTV